MPTTYLPIANYVASGASTYTFTSIPQTYTDLVFVLKGKNSNAGSSVNLWRFRFNSDTGSNYSSFYVTGNGSAAGTGSDRSQNELYWGVSNQNSIQQSVSMAEIGNYSDTNKYKTMISKGAGADGSYVNIGVGTWRSNSAITSVEIYPGGTSFTGTISLYGIKAA